jgi:hypothetical protein
MSFTAKDSSAIELLQIHFQSLWTMAQLAAGQPRARATPAFLILIDLVKRFLGRPSFRTSVDNTSHEPRPYFDYWFDFGVIGPLFFTAVNALPQTIDGWTCFC